MSAADWTAWIDGVPARSLPLDDPGFQSSHGVFRTLLAWDGQVDDLGGQWQTLRAACDVAGIPPPPSELAQQELATAAAEIGCGRLKLIVTPAIGASRRIVMAWPGAPECPGPRNGWLCDAPRFAPTLPAKTLERTALILAQRGAVDAGADVALLQNRDGLLNCANIANLYLLIDGALHTPSMASGALPGRMRARLLAAADDAGVTMIESELTAAELHMAEAILLSNSLRGLWSLTQVDAAGAAIQLSADPACLQRLQVAVPHPLHPPAG